MTGRKSAFTPRIPFLWWPTWPFFRILDKLPAFINGNVDNFVSAYLILTNEASTWPGESLFSFTIYPYHDIQQHGPHCGWFSRNLGKFPLFTNVNGKNIYCQFLIDPYKGGNWHMAVVMIGFTEIVYKYKWSLLWQFLIDPYKWDIYVAGRKSVFIPRIPLPFWLVIQNYR